MSLPCFRENPNRIVKQQQKIKTVSHTETIMHEPTPTPAGFVKWKRIVSYRNTNALFFCAFMCMSCTIQLQLWSNVMFSKTVLYGNNGKNVERKSIEKPTHSRACTSFIAHQQI